MKKLAAIFLALTMVFGLCACGGGGKTDGAASPYAGKYISVAADMWGMTLTGEDAAGMTITLENGGKGSMDVDGSNAKLTWSVEGTTLTIKVSGQTLTAAIENDAIIFEDFMGMGIGYTFGKEGTAAADPANYESSGGFIVDSESDISGTYWATSCFIDGEELNCDEDYLELDSDGTGKVYLDGEPLSITWTLDNGDFTFEDEDGDFFEGTYDSGVISGNYGNIEYVYETYVTA